MMISKPMIEKQLNKNCETNTVP